MSFEDEREFILRDAADRLGLLGDGEVSVERATEMILDRLSGTASERIVRCVKLGLVVDSLSQELAESGGTVSGAFGQGMMSTLPRRGLSERQVAALVDLITVRFVDMVFAQAEVER